MKEINETANLVKIFSSSGIMETVNRSVSLLRLNIPVSTVAPYLRHTGCDTRSAVRILVLLCLVAVGKLRVAP